MNVLKSESYTRKNKKLMDLYQKKKWPLFGFE